MKTIISEFWNGLKRSKLNNKWVKRIVILIIVLSLILLLKIILFPAVEKGEVGNSSSDDWKETERLIDKIKNGEEVVTDDSSEDIETTIKLFFVGANDAGLDLFSSVIDSEYLGSDFVMKFEVDELMSKYNEAMNRISRNGQIESVNIVSSTKMIGAKRRVVVDLKYLDLEKPVRVGIEVKTFKEEDVHADETEEYKQPLISQSIWELIDFIEEAVE